jgi:hypothetical protein
MRSISLVVYSSRLFAGERRRVAANRARLKAAKGGSIRKGRRLLWEGAA